MTSKTKIQKTRTGDINAQTKRRDKDKKLTAAILLLAKKISGIKARHLEDDAECLQKQYSDILSRI